MAPFKDAGLLQLAKLALTEVLSHGRLPAQDLTKALISKGLGVGILAGSTLVKVPQLLNVVRAKSAEGLNPLSFELETVALVIATTYGFISRLPFTAFGEVVALLVQNILLLNLVYHFQRRSAGRAAALLTLLAAWGAVAASGAVSAAHASALYDFSNVTLLVGARVPQILQNLSARSTGQLSGITYGLNTAGAAARIFTSMQEGAGGAMLRGAVLSMVLNFITVAQIVAYSGGGRKAAPKRATRSSTKASKKD